MKTIALIISFLSIGYLGFSQNLNNITEENNNAFSLGIGYDYGLVTELDFYSKLNTEFTSWINLEVSTPSGDIAFDDFQTKFGICIEAFNKNNIQLYTSFKTGFIRYNSDKASYNAIGSNLGITAGYYKSNWFFSGEFGYNNAATFHIKHSDEYREFYPDVKDGHYFLTSSHFHYGLSASYTFPKVVEVYAKAGMIAASGSDNAMLPYYAQIGIAKAF